MLLLFGCFRVIDSLRDVSVVGITASVIRLAHRPSPRSLPAMAGGFPREAVSLRCPPLPSRNFIVPIADPGGLREEAEGGAAFCAPFAMGSTTLIMRGGVPPQHPLVPRER